MNLDDWDSSSIASKTWWPDNELFNIVLDSILSDNGGNYEELDMFCWFSESFETCLNEVFMFNYKELIRKYFYNWFQ